MSRLDLSRPLVSAHGKRPARYLGKLIGVPKNELVFAVMGATGEYIVRAGEDGRGLPCDCPVIVMQQERNDAQ